MAGIDYWAFVMYPISFPATTGGLDLYFKSSHKGDIRFCMIVEHLDDDTTDRLVQYFDELSFHIAVSPSPQPLFRHFVLLMTFFQPQNGLTCLYNAL